MEKYRQYYFHQSVIIIEGIYLDEHFDLARDSLNRCLLLEEIPNNERNEIEEGQMEETEIKEGHDDEEEQDNKAEETLIANRKLLLEKITNNERNEMEEAQMEENEIKEGHDDVDEKQDNKAEETPIANRKLLLEKITNNERNEMKEEPLEEIEIKEGHEVVEEEQDNESLNARIMRVKRKLKARFERCQQVFAQEKTVDDLLYIYAIVVLEVQMEEYKKKERQKKNRCLLQEEIPNTERNEMEEGQMEETEIKEGHDDEEEQGNMIRGSSIDVKMPRVFRLMGIGISSFLPRVFRLMGIGISSFLYCSRSRYTFGVVTEEEQMQEYKKKERQKKNKKTFERFMKIMRWMQNKKTFERFMKIMRWMQFRGGQSRRKLFFRKGRNKRVQRESEKLRQYLEIWGRYDMMQHTAPKQREKLINITKDHGGFDDAEKGGGNRTVCADCHLESRPGQADNLSELHAELTPNCPFVNVKKRNADQSNDFATQTVPSREPRVDVCRRNDVTQHAAPQQKGKLIDITEDHVGFDDAEKDIQELEQLLRCKVCLDSDACIVFLPCRHMATCEYCEGFLHHCPVCRSFIEEAVKINEE